MRVLAGLGAAAEPGDEEQHGRERHHGEAEQPVARPAAPDQVRADDEPDEQVERARPRSTTGSRRRARPGRRAARSAAASRSARPTSRARVARRGVRERGLAVAEQRRPEEQLKHRRSRLRRGELDELPDLALEALQLRRDDQHVGQHADEDDEVGARRRVLLGLGRHCSARSSPRARAGGRRGACPRARAGRASTKSDDHREPADAEREELEFVICGPSRVKTVGWMSSARAGSRGTRSGSARRRRARRRRTCSRAPARRRPSSAA